MSSLLSMDGRLNRARYFWTNFIIGLALDILLIMSGGLMGEDDSSVSAVVALIVLASVAVGMVVMAFQVVKRLHDLERPGSQYWLLLVPFYNIYLGFVLLCVKGTTGPNRYGADPLARQSRVQSAQYVS